MNSSRMVEFFYQISCVPSCLPFGAILIEVKNMKLRFESFKGHDEENLVQKLKKISSAK